MMAVDLSVLDLPAGAACRGSGSRACRVRRS